MSKTEIIAALRDLSARMQEVGAAMDYYGGFEPHIADHGRQLINAGFVVAWRADQWEKMS